MRVLAVLAALLLAAPGFARAGAAADEPTAAKPDSPFAFFGFLAARVEFDRERTDIAGPASARSVAYAKAFLQGRLRHVPTGFFLEGAIALEVTRDPGGSFYFAGQDAYVQQAMVGWQDDVWRLWAGKFRPNFGKAPADAPGLFGTDASSNGYELLERLGFGVSWNGPAQAWGAPTLEVSAFSLDTGVMSTAFFNRQRNTKPGVFRSSPHRLGDGGVGNTGAPDNVLAAAQVVDLFGRNGLVFTGGLMRQGEGRDGGGEEWRMAAALQWSRTFQDGSTLKTIAEAVRLSRDPGGHAFYTLGAGWSFGDWTPSLVATLHPRSQAAFGYADLTLAPGLEWRLAKVAGGALVFDLASKHEWLPNGRRDTLGAAVTFFRNF